MKMKSCILFFSYIMMVFAEDTAIQKILHDGNTQFTAKLFSEVVKENQGKSVVLSAFSVLTPLSQLAAASEGPSHDELVNAVGFPDDNTANAVFALIDEKFNSVQGVELKKASKIYVAVAYEIKDEFANISKYVYHSEIDNINFNDNENAAKEINTWVEGETNNRIKDLVDPSAITPDTRAVLVNALYFKGSWKYPFRDFATRSQRFYINKQESLQIQMMHNTEGYKYIESGSLQSKILELPYKGDESSFVIVLPNDVEGIEQLLEKLKNFNILEEEMKKMNKFDVRVDIPKFKIETTTNLKKVLMNMNVKKIFGANANLTKLLKTDEDLYVTDAVQKAFIEVNEQGAEAAAANAFLIGIGTSVIYSPIFNFVADHPFAFFLKVYGEIIFTGVFYGP